MVEFCTYGNKRKGFLSYFEVGSDLPFDIKRIYYIYKVPKGITRGYHAHISLDQVIWCIYGSVTIIIDDGIKRESVTLDNPSTGLIVGKGIWREMTWNQENSILCVAASKMYDESDYIRNYSEFIRRVKEGNWKKL